MAPTRIRRAHAELHRAGLDALLVTHPANVAYLTGLTASAAIAIVLRTSLSSSDSASPDEPVSDLRCVLIVDSRYAISARTIEGASPALTVRVAAGSLDDEAVAQLRARAVRRVGVEAAHLNISRYNRIAAALASTEGAPISATGQAPLLVTTERVIERMRAVKDAGEIETLREAGRRISAVARRARTWIQPGRTERQIAAAVDAAMRTAGFERPAFDTIVAAGANAALPHARPTNRVVGANEGVLLDFGGVYDGYCVDLTRTVHIGPMPDGFRRLFDAVRDAQAAAIAALTPGALLVDIDAAARRVMERHGLGAAFGHGTGHGLGLEVHEEPRISPLAPAGEPVQAGMVVTIEPGAYVPGIGGVRIEDDVLVTAGGGELLTDVPIEL